MDLGGAKLGDLQMATIPYEVVCNQLSNPHTCKRFHGPLSTSQTPTRRLERGGRNRRHLQQHTRLQMVICKFFSYTATPTQLVQLLLGTTIPCSPLQVLAAKVQRGQIQPSITRPIYFQQPHSTNHNKQRQSSTTTGVSLKFSRGNTCNQTQLNSSTRQSTEPHTRTLNRKYTTVLETHKAAKNPCPELVASEQPTTLTTTQP